MTSASLIINNILVQINELVPKERFEEVKMILNMNLCNYAFIKNEDCTGIVKNTDMTYEMIKAWQQALILEGLVQSTIKQYSTELKQLILYTGISPLEMQEYHIRSYLAYGKIEKKWKDKTFNSKVRSLRSFFKWAYEEDVTKENPMKKIKETKEEFRMGKGRKEREIYFSAQARVHLQDYLNTRTDNNRALLVSEKMPYNRLSIAGVQYIIKQIQRRDERLAGLKISPHTFRRTCGTDMLNRGAPIEMVKEKLGHTKADTTLQCYARISTESIRDAERRFGAA